MFQLAWQEQSLGSYFFGGLPSFLASTVLEQLAVPDYKKYPMYAVSLPLIQDTVSLTPAGSKMRQHTTAST
jgi:hypothetical protein